MTDQVLRTLIREETSQIMNEMGIRDVIMEQSLLESILTEAALFDKPQDIIDNIVPLLIQKSTNVLQTVTFGKNSNLQNKSIQIQISDPQWEVFKGSENDPETWIIQDTIAGNIMKRVVGTSGFTWVPFSKGHKKTNEYSQAVAVKTGRESIKNPEVNMKVVDSQGRLIMHPDFSVVFPEMQLDWGYVFQGLVGIAAARLQGNQEVEKKLTSWFFKTFTFDEGIFAKLSKKVKDAIGKAIQPQPATQPAVA